MANWNDLKASVAEAIKTNGNQEITGQILQNTLNSIISNLGENATFAGIATPNTNPGTPDGNVFYLASQGGTYSNFSSIIVRRGELAVLTRINNTWIKNSIEISNFIGDVPIENFISEVNVSKIYPTDGTDGTDKYTLNTALRKIPSELRTIGIKCVFINSENKLETWEYQGGGFSVISNWKLIGSIVSEDLSKLKQGLTLTKAELSAEQVNANIDIVTDITVGNKIPIYISKLIQSESQKYIIRTINSNGAAIETFYSNITLSEGEYIDVMPTLEANAIRIVVLNMSEDVQIELYVNPLESILSLAKDIDELGNNTLKEKDRTEIEGEIQTGLRDVYRYKVDLFSLGQKNYYYDGTGEKVYAGGLYLTTNIVKYDGMKSITVIGNTHSNGIIPVILPFDSNGDVISGKILYGDDNFKAKTFTLELTEEINAIVAQTRFTLSGASIILTCETSLDNILRQKEDCKNIMHGYLANAQKAISNRFISYMQYNKNYEETIPKPSEVANAAGIRIPTVEILPNGNKLVLALVNLNSVGDYSEFKEYVYILNALNSVDKKYEFVDNMTDLGDGIAYPTTCRVGETVYLFYTKITQDSNGNVTQSATYVCTTTNGENWSNSLLLNDEAGFLCGGGSKAFEDDGVIYVPFLMRSNNKKDAGFLAYNIDEKTCYKKMLCADLGTDECSIYPDGLGNILISTRMTDGTAQGLYKISKNEYEHTYEKVDVDVTGRLALQECCLYCGNGIVLRSRATNPTSASGWQRGNHILEVSYDFGFNFAKICDISGSETVGSGGYTSLAFDKVNQKLIVVYEAAPYRSSTFKICEISASLKQEVSFL